MSLPGFLSAVVWTAVTVLAYLLGLALRRWTHRHPLANPALVAIVVVAALVCATDTPYETYFRATWILTFLLAPATVALGIPLAKHFGHIRSNLVAVGLGLLAGSFSSMLSGALLVRLLGGTNELAKSMLPKAVTTPIAIAVSQQIGGQPALTATLAILGGIIAAITLRAVLGFMRITHEPAVGLAAGTAGSGIAAAHVAVLGDAPAAFAAIGIGLNGLLTSLAAPHIAAFFS
jgi:putative effector of murein hydrolase